MLTVKIVALKDYQVLNLLLLLNLIYSFLKHSAIRV